MKITYKIVILLISVIVFSACSNKQNTQKEKINKLFSSVYLKNKGKDSIFYIDNKKDIEKFNNLYKDVDSLIENEKFYISYNCTFSKKTKNIFFNISIFIFDLINVYLNDIYCVIGNLNFKITNI